MIEERKIDVPLPSLTKKEVIERIKMMIKNGKNEDVVVNLKNVLSYVRRIKE